MAFLNEGGGEEKEEGGGVEGMEEEEEANTTRDGDDADMVDTNQNGDSSQPTPQGLCTHTPLPLPSNDNKFSV